LYSPPGAKAYYKCLMGYYAFNKLRDRNSFTMSMR
jgi:hypothetical protein